MTALRHRFVRLQPARGLTPDRRRVSERGGARPLQEIGTPSRLAGGKTVYLKPLSR